jgi:YebC/PmpR family DNA-binding regulatory protein
MAGHSQFKNIMHRKGAQDAKRAKIFTKLQREITVSAKLGLPDPAMNPRLRAAIQAARKENMPKDNIDRAIQRAAGGSDSAQFDEVWYEGYGPAGVALMILAMTDNRNRTVAEIRAALTRANGTLGENGSVSWMFDQVGTIAIQAGDTDPDEISLVAIDAGATDVAAEDGIVEVYTEPHDLHRVQEELSGAGYEIDTAELSMKPKTLMSPDTDDAVKAIRLLEKLEDLDDVQTVYSNLDITDEVMAAVS